MGSAWDVEALCAAQDVRVEGFRFRFRIQGTGLRV